jgi:5'(3')-deoxyribonucleotidase
LRASIAVDMDEVIADALTEHILRYNREFSETLCLEQMQGRSIWDCVPRERLVVLEGYMRSDDFFADLGVMPDAQRVLAALQVRYDIFIASAAMEVPTSFQAKFRWLARHFPFIPSSHIVFCGDKSVLRTDYLIDDNPRQLRLFTQPGVREGILFTSPGNAGVTGFRRVNGWADVEQMFLG